MEASKPYVREQPLSPHLTAYKWHVSMAMSITHRATGVALVVGAVLLGLLLVAAAVGEEMYQPVVGFLNNPLGRIFLFGWTLSLYYHLINGIRHLLWDGILGFAVKDVTGKGMDRNAMAIGTLTVLCTSVSWYIWGK